MFGRNAFVGIVAGAMVLWMQGIHDARPASSVEMSCHDAAPGVAAVTVEWRAPEPGAIETWLDLAVTPGFIEGTFQSYGPLRPEVRAHVVGGAPIGVRYHYRVNALYADGWRQVASDSFVSACPAAP
jgi:hypothetical protein